MAGSVVALGALAVVEPAVAVLAEATTTTTEVVDRVVGEPLASWVVLAASAALLVVILLAGFVASRRMRAAERR